MSEVPDADPLVNLCALLADLSAEAEDPRAPQVVEARKDVYRFLADSGWVPPPRVQLLLSLDQFQRELALERWSGGRLSLLVVQRDASLRAELRRQMESSHHLRLVGEARDPAEALLLASYVRPHLALVDAALPEAADLVRQLGGAGTSAALVPFPLLAPEQRVLELGLQAAVTFQSVVVPDLASADPDAAQAAAAAERDLRRVTRPIDATRRLVALVQELGGDLAAAQEHDSALLALDLSFAQGPPLLPRAEPYTLARLRLELHLPPLVEVARQALAANER